jgi:tetratricopeptide (TPR) repeat protein
LRVLRGSSAGFDHRISGVKRIVLATFAVLICAAVTYGYTAARRERTFGQLIDAGEVALARDDTFAAIESFSGAITLKDDAMLGYLKRGEAYRRRQQLDSAGRDPHQVVRLDPAADAAMRDLLRATELDPLAPRPLELLGDVNYAMRRFGRAAERYQRYVELDDRSPRVLYKLGLALYSGRRPGAAVRALEKAVEIDDRFAEAFYLLGLCFRDTLRRDRSLRALETSVRLAPAMVHVREELADLYGRLGRIDDRIAQLEALLALDRGPSRHVALGLAYARDGQFDRAVTTLGQAAERYPDESYAYVALGRVWLEKSQSRPDRVDLSKAIGALQEAVGSEDSSEALTLFGRALLLSQNVDEAETVLQQATEKLPVDPQAFYYLADAAERRGHADTARRALLDYSALEGEEQDVRRRGAFAARIADLSMLAGDPGSAAVWYQRALEGPGDDTPLLVKFAEAQLRSGAPGAARATVEKALEKDPLNRDGRALLRRLEVRRSPE